MGLRFNPNFHIPSCSCTFHVMKSSKLMHAHTHGHFGINYSIDSNNIGNTVLQALLSIEQNDVVWLSASQKSLEHTMNRISELFRYWINWSEKQLKEFHWFASASTQSTSAVMDSKIIFTPFLRKNEEKKNGPLHTYIYATNGPQTNTELWFIGPNVVWRWADWCSNSFIESLLCSTILPCNGLLWWLMTLQR